MILTFAEKHPYFVILDGQYYTRFSTLQAAARTAIVSGGYIIDRSGKSGDEEKIYENSACRSLLDWHSGRF